MNEILTAKSVWDVGLGDRLIDKYHLHLTKSSEPLGDSSLALRRKKRHR